MCQPIYQFSLIAVSIWGRGLRRKTLLQPRRGDGITLSLERPPKPRTLAGAIWGSEYHVTFNYNLTDRPLLAGVRFMVEGRGRDPFPCILPTGAC
jgi:hypothetical protein